MTDTDLLDFSFQAREDDSTAVWDDACRRFLAAVDGLQRMVVELMLTQPHQGGAGLRAWFDAVAWRGAVLPDRIPPEVIDVYIHDAEALPLNDCEDCGLAVPVRPNRIHGFDAEPEYVYFPTCPACGGRTGAYSYCAKHSGSRPSRPKPR
jgi:hypothetical protein